MTKIDLQFFGGRGASSGGGGGDPVLGKQGKPKTEDAALAASNPNYSQGRAYQVNCQRCISAYELQRRGYNVEAQAATLTKNEPMFQNNRWMHSFVGQTWTKQGDLGNRSTAVEKNITSKMQSWGEGSRGVVYVEWKSGSAHVFNVENKGGKVTIHEAQTGKKYSLSDYLSSAKPSKTMISRVDNLAPDPNVMKYAVKKKGS